MRLSVLMEKGEKVIWLKADSKLSHNFIIARPLSYLRQQKSLKGLVREQ